MLDVQHERRTLASRAAQVSAKRLQEQQEEKRRQLGGELATDGNAAQAGYDVPRDAQELNELRRLMILASRFRLLIPHRSRHQDAAGGSSHASCATRLGLTPSMLGYVNS